MIYNRRLHSIQYDCLLHTTGSLIMYNRRPEYIYIYIDYGAFYAIEKSIIYNRILYYTYLYWYIYTVADLIIYNRRPRYIWKGGLSYTIGSLWALSERRVSYQQHIPYTWAYHPHTYALSYIWLGLAMLRASKNEKPYKNIDKIDKTDPESHRNYKNHTKTLIKLIKLILRQLWRPGSLGCTIVVSGSVLLVLLMFLYGFWIFGSPQDQSYQYY